MSMWRSMGWLAMWCLGASVAQAQSAAEAASVPVKLAPASAVFSQKKQKALEHINAQITQLQTAQACVQAASDAAALKSCHAAAAARKR